MILVIKSYRSNTQIFLTIQLNLIYLPTAIVSPHICITIAAQLMRYNKVIFYSMTEIFYFTILMWLIELDIRLKAVWIVFVYGVLIISIKIANISVVCRRYAIQFSE